MSESTRREPIPVDAPATGVPRIESRQKLSDREIEVLSLISEGMSNKEAAEALFISKRTVDFHLQNIYEVFGVKNRSAAIYAAMKRGLIR